ncbi:MAG: aminotransferase class V-fold PLP-dependent enzyme [Verrucomicrobiia bacterium]
MSFEHLTEFIEEPVQPDIWELDREVVFLNHGSFGACPKQILDIQTSLRKEMERQPVKFFVRELEPRIDEARKILADFVDADADSLVFVPNVTYAINCVFNSLKLKEGDEILITNHEYNACKNIAEYAAKKSGAKVVVANIPFPLKSEAEIINSLLSGVNPKTRLVLLDHITSQTGLIFPIKKIVVELKKQGVPVLIDGAHAPGMIQLSLRDIGADFYAGNCHKWLCAPKGAGFLYVKKEWQAEIRPIAISHGANSQRTDRSRYLIEFGWTGTDDPTPYLCVPKVIEFFGNLISGGWEQIRKRNRALALAARKILCETLQLDPAQIPEEFIGSMVSFLIWDASDKKPPKSPLYMDRLQTYLWENHKIEVPVVPWENNHRILRISAQLYNHLDQYRRLAEALKPARAKRI